MKSRKAKYYRFKTEAEIVAAAGAIMEAELIRSGERLEMHSAKSVREYLAIRCLCIHREVFSILLLNTKHQLLETVDLFEGTIDGSSVYPREVIKTVLDHNAAAVILAHNHPSGNPEPSNADHQITKRIIDALAMIDVRVLDHIISARGRTYSFAEHGHI